MRWGVRRAVLAVGVLMAAYMMAGSSSFLRGVRRGAVYRCQLPRSYSSSLSSENGEGNDYDRPFPRVRSRISRAADGAVGGEEPSWSRRGVRERSGGRGQSREADRRGAGARNSGRMRIDFRDNRDNRAESRGKPYGEYDGDHIYGVSPVKAALTADRRKIEELLVQEGMKVDAKKDSKGASEILALAKQKGVPIREFPKHDLNMLSDNRPHQGFILRASALRFKRLESAQALSPHPLDASNGDSNRNKVVLALDEVWDPQNFGALLRTAHFLPGVAEVIVCAKNSAPLSETVSKASSGAMESMEVYSVDNMMKFLDNSIGAGWQVVGTSLGEESVLMADIPKDRPTILVLGNEGHGIRTNVLRKCSHLVRIDGGQADGAVDSLNVSVTGGIMLHFLST